MNRTEEITAFALLDGYTYQLCDTDHPRQKCWYDPEGNELGCGEWRLPDYLNDLNAIRSIELKMGDQTIDYCNILRNIVTKGYPSDPLFPIKLLLASIDDRREAILFTYGLGKPSTKE